MILKCIFENLQKTFNFMAVSLMPLRTNSLVARQDNALPWSARVGVILSREMLAFPSSDTCIRAILLINKQEWQESCSVKDNCYLLTVTVQLQITHPPGDFSRWPRTNCSTFHFVFPVRWHWLIGKRNIQQ